jgi:hypothetical protein
MRVRGGQQQVTGQLDSNWTGATRGQERCGRGVYARAAATATAPAWNQGAFKVATTRCLPARSMAGGWPRAAREALCNDQAKFSFALCC